MPSFVLLNQNTTYTFVHGGGLSSSAIGEGLTKKVEGSFTSMPTFIPGHFPISSLKLKACC